MTYFWVFGQWYTHEHACTHTLCLCWCFSIQVILCVCATLGVCVYGSRLHVCESYLAVNLTAPQSRLDDIEQSICQALTLPHPPPGLLPCRTHVPVTHTQRHTQTHQWTVHLKNCVSAHEGYWYVPLHVCSYLCDRDERESECNAL